MAATNKTTKTEASVESYLDGVADEERQRDARALTKLLSKATKEKPAMWGSSIVGFGSYHYKYESGREGEMCLIGFSSRKGDISVYGLGHSPKVEALLARLGKYKRGKGYLYLKRLGDVDQDVLVEAVALSMAEKKRAQM
jgi:hypothetical protein